MFNQRIRLGKLFIHCYLQTVIFKSFFPTLTAFTHPDQQGLDIGHRFGNDNFFFIFSGDSCQLDKIK